MDTISCDGMRGDAEESDKIYYTDLNNNSESELDAPPLRLDHCDLLLDAMDAQLGQMQVQSYKHPQIYRDSGCNSAPLTWSQSLSKDTGFGSTTKTIDTPMSCLDLTNTHIMGQLSERSMSCKGSPIIPEETEHELDKNTRDKEESEREQVIWRLEKLLGETCTGEGMAEGSSAPSESICTEDFVTRFRDEMVDLGSPQNEMQQPGREDKVERTGISNTFDSVKTQDSAVNVGRRETSTTGRSIKHTETAHCSRANMTSVRKELEKCLPDSFVTKTSCGEKDAGGACRAQQRHSADNRRSYRIDVRKQETQQQSNSGPSKARCLAGVPLLSFDTVSIDSDLSSVCTEQSRQHIQRNTGWCSGIYTVTGMDDFSSNQSDYDTAMPKNCETPSSSCHRSSDEKGQNTSSTVRKAHCMRRTAYRLKCSSDDKDTDEEMNNWRRRGRSDKKNEKIQTGLAKMKERLKIIRQECQKEAEMLKLKKTQLKDAEISLSEVQHKRNHALQVLEHLTEEAKQMEKEKRMLESALKDTRTEKDSVSCKLLELQRTKESRIKEPRVVMSLMERDEMDRQLHMAKTKLIAEQRCSREKLESMQEKLEETCDKLQRITEAERLWKTRCAFLEEKQKHKKDQIEEKLGECQIRVGTLENKLAQKELQLLELKEQHEVLAAERDGLMGELQHCKTEQCHALKEAQEQAQKIMLKEEQVRKQRNSLEKQRADLKYHEEELRIEAMEKVHAAVEEAKGKWDAEKKEAVKNHCRMLEEQNKKNLESLQSELQGEKSKNLALRSKVMDLKTKAQEVKCESSRHKKEQESLLANVCKSQREEHQAELQEMRRKIEQESRRTVQQLEQAVQLAEKEADRMRLMLEEKENSHLEITAELDGQLRLCAQELREECQQLLVLLEQNGAKASVQISVSPTVSEAFANLRMLRERVKNMNHHLQRELDSQKQTMEQLKKEKERDLSIQRQQLRMERNQALDFLKERLIQEHIEDLSTLNLAHVCDGGAAVSLRKQLKAKDVELRQVQRSMAQWKEQTTARLACKFEEELTAELERKASKNLSETQRKFARSEGGPSLPGEAPQASVGSPSIHAAVTHIPSDVASLKLLHYLQSRVTQLRRENETFTSTPLSSKSSPLELSSTMTQDISVIPSLNTKVSS